MRKRTVWGVVLALALTAVVGGVSKAAAPFAPKDFRVFERPAAALASLDADGWRRLGTELVRTRDGQLVLGREEAIRLDLHDARAPLGVTAARRPAARR